MQDAAVQASILKAGRCPRGACHATVWWLASRTSLLTSLWRSGTKQGHCCWCYLRMILCSLMNRGRYVFLLFLCLTIIPLEIIRSKMECCHHYNLSPIHIHLVCGSVVSCCFWFCGLVTASKLLLQLLLSCSISHILSSGLKDISLVQFLYEIL